MNKAGLYDNFRKQSYRQWFWGFTGRRFGFLDADGLPYKIYQDAGSRRKAIAVLDSSSAFETIHLLRSGYSGDLIWVANDAVRKRGKAAFKARFTSSLKEYGFANTCHVFPGISMAEMVETAVNKKWNCRQEFDVINLDACSPVGGWKWACMIMNLKDRLAPGGVFGLTVLAGRESQVVKDFVSGFAEKLDGRERHGHDLRRWYIRQLLDHGETHLSGSPQDESWSDSSQIIYRGNNVPMLAVAARIAQGSKQFVTVFERRAAARRLGYLLYSERQEAQA